MESAVQAGNRIRERKPRCAVRDHRGTRGQVLPDPVPVLVLNSDSSDELDYDADPNLKALS